MDADVERARAILTEGGGLDEALAVIDATAPPAIAWIKAAREVTGFSLQDSLLLREDNGNGVPLGHLRAREVALLAGMPADRTRHARGWFRSALVHREPAVTVFRGIGLSEGGVEFRRGDHADRGPRPDRLGWTGGDFAEIRAELLALPASDHPLGRRVTVEDRGPDAFVVRFDLA